MTVNQTHSLTHQAVSVSWTGAPPTVCSGGAGSAACVFQGDYLQIMECWSDPQTQQGPDPTQCEYGGESSTPTSSYPVGNNTGFEYSRNLSKQGWSNYSTLQAAPTFVDTTDNFDIEPFDAVDGTVVDQQADYGWDENPYAPKQFWLNPYYSFTTTNEVDFARTYANGTGQQLFDVDTGLEAPGLGCGQDIEPGAGKVDIVPSAGSWSSPGAPPSRRTHRTPASGTVRGSSPHRSRRRPGPTGSRSRSSSTRWAAPVPSGATPSRSWATSWPNRRRPAGCRPSVDSRALRCSATSRTATKRPARTWSPRPTARPACPCSPTRSTPSQVDATNPVVYAPLTLSGVVVAFNIERYPGTDPSTGQPYPGERAARRRSGGQHLPHPSTGGQAPDRVLSGPARGRDQRQVALLRLDPAQSGEHPDGSRLPAVQPGVRRAQHDSAHRRRHAPR